MSGYATQRYFKLQNPLLEAKQCNDKLYVIDKENYLYIFDKNYDLESKVRLLKDKPQEHYFSNAYSICCDNIAIPAGKNLVWATYKNKKVVPAFKKPLHDKDIFYTHYCDTARHLISAGTDGKVYLMDVENKTTRYIFKNKPDFCSCALFSKTKSFAFVAYFNGENTLLNLKNDKTVHFKTDNPIEAASFFDEDKGLLLTDREGNSILYDCIDSQVVSQTFLFDQWISCVCLSPNKKFIIAGSRKNKLYLVDPFKNTVVQTIELDDDGVTSISIEGQTLHLSFANATIQSIDLAYKKEEFLIHTELKEYDKAKKILDANNFLYLDDAITKFRSGFDEVLVKAKELIAKGAAEQALGLVEPFMQFKEYKERLDLLFMQQHHIANFIQAVEKKDIETAYALAKKHPTIESLNAYQNLEKRWEKLFAQARKVLEEDDLRGKAKAKEILSAYEKIPQKMELVKQLINNAKQFAIADGFIKKQDFSSYFKLVNKFDFLSQTKLYEKVQNLAASVYQKALDDAANNNYEKAQKSFEYLMQFPYYRSQAKKELEKVNVLVEFEKALAKDDKKKVYELVSQHMFLSFCESFKKYNKTFEKCYNDALFNAQSGKIALAIRSLKAYLQIAPLKQRVANCLKLGYLNEIAQAKADDFDQNRVLMTYHSLFGVDEELEKLYAKKGYKELYESFAKSPKREEIASYPETIL